MPETVTVPQATGPAVDDLVHVACYAHGDPTAALCGFPTSAEEKVEGDVDFIECVVCLDLEDYYDAAGICCPKDPAVRRG